MSMQGSICTSDRVAQCVQLAKKQKCDQSVFTVHQSAATQLRAPNPSRCCRGLRLTYISTIHPKLLTVQCLRKPPFFHTKAFIRGALRPVRSTELDGQHVSFVMGEEREHVNSYNAELCSSLSGPLVSELYTQRLLQITSVCLVFEQAWTLLCVLDCF